MIDYPTAPGGFLSFRGELLIRTEKAKQTIKMVTNSRKKYKVVREMRCNSPPHDCLRILTRCTQALKTGRNRNCTRSGGHGLAHKKSATSSPSTEDSHV